MIYLVSFASSCSAALFSLKGVYLFALLFAGILSLSSLPHLGLLIFFWYLIQFLTLGKVPPHDGVPEWSKSPTNEGTHLLMSSSSATTYVITCPYDELWLVEGCPHIDPSSPLNQPQIAR